jgi:hypothetical protein
MTYQLLTLCLLGCVALVYFAPTFIALIRGLDLDDLGIVVFLNVLGFFVFTWIVAMIGACRIEGRRAARERAERHRFTP